MSTSRATCQAIVVGAGPGGAALAYLLASRGIETVLIERHADFDREFRGEGFQPSGVTCLDQMGLSAPFAEVPQRVLSKIQLHNGHRVLEVPIPRGPAELTRMVSQPRFLTMMTDEASRHPSFELLMGTAVRDLIVESGRVRGVVLEGGREIRSALVVGADGRGSIVRRRTALPVTELGQVFDVLWTKVDLGGFLDEPDVGRMEIAGDHQVLVYPSPEGNHQMGLVLAKGQGHDQPHDNRWSWIQTQVSAELAAALDASGGPLSGPALLNVVCDRLDESWSEPGMLLIGDAAHTMSPVGGQGVNMALRDAVVAANHLVPAFAADNDALDRACRNLADERLPEIRLVQDMQTAEGVRFRKPNQFVLRVLLPLVLKLAPSKIMGLNRRRARMRAGLADIRLRV